jgi:hypothetical protein
MHFLPMQTLSVAATPRDNVATIRRACAVLHRVFNGTVVLAAVIQFYTIGLVMFGVTGLESHRIFGWMTQMAGLLSLLTALGAGRTLARPLAALGLFGLLLLQPALAFGLRPVAPAFAALHSVNGLLILAVAISIELRWRRRQ